MKKELEDKLIEIAPWMFRYENWNDIRSTLISFGFECGDGWYEIFKELIEEIKKIDINKTCRVIQIKEKYGTIRFYENSAPEVDDQITKLIRKAEEKSKVTCEVCGKEGHLIQGGWWMVRCEECEDQR
jgi:hypothetical protein